ncbi:MAG: hemolysin III family protein [Ruminococcaceae bacterium]|nr:hemolysin III family protein [Oscillospiraceae bacterium]
MKRTRLADRKMPAYTKGEEIFNMTSHIVGGALGILAIVLCSVFAGLKKDVYGVVSGVIFGSTMLILYTMSSIYHGLRPDTMAKKVFQVIDHCSIFILIAGTYTPIALCTMRQLNAFEGWALFGIIWGIAALGITLNSIDLKKYKKFSMVCYLVMGWCIIIRIGVLINAVGMSAFWLLLSGGIAYTIGAVFYGIIKKKWMHSVFHLFCIIGSILHFLFILFYIII